jgi:hypothetical protein
MYALAVPLKPDKVEAWKSWVRELTGARREEFEAFSERMGLTFMQAWLTQTPDGWIGTGVFDGPGAEDFLQKLANSQEPFDEWFREHTNEYHTADFSKPDTAPRSEIYLDWHAPSYVEARQ